MPDEFFALAYRGQPPWDIGRAQGAFRCLAEAGEIEGRVLDVGCGTGENALFLAAEGRDVVGVDTVAVAIRRASVKARRRALHARFAVHDALRLDELGESFDSVIDSGLFHTFDDDERVLFRGALAVVLRPGGRYYVLCFSQHETGTGGPRRVTRSEIRGVFDVDPFAVLRIDSALLETRDGGSRQAWLAVVERRRDED